MTVLRPADATEIAEAVAWADAGSQSLEIVAGGSKRALGRPPQADHTLDLSRLSGIVDYEPSELVLTARAATPMSEIEAQLRSHGQMLAFEPADWRGLLGKTGEPTLGGTLACNMAGPRRVRAGAARDHFLGFSAVNGWGERWKAGGRVVKNVTGYDMGKLQAGAYGTLSVLTEVSLKTMPRPETSCSLLVRGLADQAAIVLLATALNSPHEVSAAAHLPVALAGRAGPAALAGVAATVLRLEGPKPSVDSRALALDVLLGATERLGEADSVTLWSAICAVQPLIGEADRLVWRICPKPSAAPTVLNAIRANYASAEGFYDWGGGLLWLALDPGDAGTDGGAAVVRRAVAAAGGHATLIRAPDAIRAEIPVFEPAPPALDALSRRVKAGFDPHGILNPGRMQKGF